MRIHNCRDRLSWNNEPSVDGALMMMMMMMKGGGHTGVMRWPSLMKCRSRCWKARSHSRCFLIGVICAASRSASAVRLAWTAVCVWPLGQVSLLCMPPSMRATTKETMAIFATKKLRLATSKAMKTELAPNSMEYAQRSHQSCGRIQRAKSARNSVADMRKAGRAKGRRQRYQRKYCAVQTLLKGTETSAWTKETEKMSEEEERARPARDVRSICGRKTRRASVEAAAEVSGPADVSGSAEVPHPAEVSRPATW